MRAAIRNCRATVTDPRDPDRTIDVRFDVTSWGTDPDPWGDDPGAPPEIYVQSYLVHMGPGLLTFTDEHEDAIEAEIIERHMPEREPEDDA